MWWLALKRGETVKNHSELDFMWAYSSIKDGISNKILHYTGSIANSETKFFRKSNYGCCSPFLDDFSLIEKKSASKILVDEIKKYNHSQLKNRIDLTDVSFLIPIRVDSNDRIENLKIVVNYIQSVFSTTIIILEADNLQKIDPSTLSGITYHFVEDNNPIFHRTKYINHLIYLADTPIISVYDADVILPDKQITSSVDKLRANLSNVVYPYDGTFISIDRLMKTIFSKHLDVGFLEHNKAKQCIATRRSFGGCVLLNKKSYLEAGGENENLTSWGSDGIERKKRMEKLGYKVIRVPGNLFHLPHLRSENSRYVSQKQYKKLMDEYFKICKMDKHELREYINCWPWCSKNETTIFAQTI